MKFSTSASVALSISMLLATTSLAPAQVLAIRQALTQCPDVRQATACPMVATDFLAAHPPSRQSDAKIVDLVLALAERGQTPLVRLPVCLNTADGLRVLATGVQEPERAQQILSIADALCENTQTAAIGGGAPGGGGSDGVPQSLIEGNSSAPVDPEDPKPEDPKPEDPKPEDPKPEDPKPENPKPENPKPENPKPEKPKPEKPKPNDPDCTSPGESDADPDGEFNENACK